MALPTTYTEAELKAYIHGELAEVASVLSWSVAGGSYDEIVNDALYLAGVSSISTVSGVTAVYNLRKLAQLAAWRRVVAAVSMDYDFSADGASYSRSQVLEQARKRVRDLEYETAGYRADYAVTVTTVDAIHNPYQDRDPMERVL